MKYRDEKSWRSVAALLMLTAMVMSLMSGCAMLETKEEPVATAAPANRGEGYGDALPKLAEMFSDALKREEETEEPAIVVTEAAPAPEVTEPVEEERFILGEVYGGGEAAYRYITWDRSYTTVDQSSGMNYYFKYVELVGNSPAYDKINGALYADAERHMTFYETVGGEIRDIAGNPIVGNYTAESTIVYNQNGLLCIKVYTVDGMGGNTDHHDSYSLFFNLNTGEYATLPEITGMEPSVLLPKLQQAAWEGLQEMCGYMLMDDAYDTLMGMTLDDYDYFVQDGELWLHFRKYLMAAGAAGAQNIPTGIYIGGN